MGRKSQSKQTTKKTPGKENNKFELQKRKELMVLVDKVLRLTSVFQATTNLAKSWEHHLEIDAILKEIVNLEYPQVKTSQRHRKNNIDNFMKWLKENGVKVEGIEIAEFEGYDLGLRATKDFAEGTLMLTVPGKVMMTEKNAKESELATFISVDPLLQNMPNIVLALFLLLEKSNPDSFWKPYIDSLPQKFTTILFYTAEELSELRPSPVFDSSLKLFRSIARQYAYFYNKIHTLDLPVFKKLQDIFTFDNYRWAVSTVMTRQNILLSDNDSMAFIPLWDMCNHEQGKLSTDYNRDLEQSDCYALRDFKSGEQVFIYYGTRPNASFFLHNGFVCPNNKDDSLKLTLGVSGSDPLCETRMALLNKLGLACVTHYTIYRENPITPELLAFIRIFSMNQEELTKWESQGTPGDLVSSEEESSRAVGSSLDRRAYTYLMTRCRLIIASYKKGGEIQPDNIHRKTVKLLKECEVQTLEIAIKYIEDTLQKLPADDKQ